MLFVGNYNICEYFYSDNLEMWWELRTNIYSIMFALAMFIALLGTSGLLRFILSVGVGLCMSDVVDQIFFDITTFNKSDIAMIFITLTISTYEYVRNRNK